MKILFLEDDPIIGDIVLDFLSESYSVTHCFDSASALSKAEEEKFDLYIFDINVPGISGLKLLQTLREFSDATPAIFITAYQEISYMREAFTVGANDFIRKPFELEELQMRIENLKKQFSLEEHIIIDKYCSFNPLTHQILNSKKSITLSSKESALLHYLIRFHQRVVSSDELLSNLWNFDEMPSTDTIRTYVKKLRQIIGKEHILNIRGEGYRFE